MTEKVKKAANIVFIIFVLAILIIGITDRSPIDDPVADKAKTFSELPKKHQAETFKNCKPTGKFVKIKQGFSEVKDCNGVTLVKDIVQ